MILQQRGKLNDASANVLQKIPTISFAKPEQKEFSHNQLETTEALTLPQRLTCYILINPWTRRQDQENHVNEGCFANKVKPKKAFAPSCQLHKLTVTRHKLSAMLLRRLTIILVND